MKLYINRAIIILCIFIGCRSYSAASLLKNFTLRLKSSEQQLTVKTVSQAIITVQNIINDLPVGDVASREEYEKKKSYILTKCAYILYDNAYIQLLEALREIDNRLIYWQYQKDHQLKYFFTKNPLKWFMGAPQSEEIENNLQKLESYQGELFALVGLLALQGNVFEEEHKNVFIHDDKKCYEWIDALLNTLIRISTTTDKKTDDKPLFLIRANQLLLKLKKVDQFKDDLLLEVNETKIPARFEQNWLKYGALMLALGYGYNSFDQLKTSLGSAKSNFGFYIINPVKNIVEDVFGGRQAGEDSVLLRTRATILELTKDFVVDMSKKYGIDKGSKNKILKGLEDNDYTEYLKFLAFIEGKEQPLYNFLAKPTDLLNSGRGTMKFFELLILSGAVGQEKQFAGVAKLLLLMPATFIGGLMYGGYQKITTKDYSALRIALVNISSLFLDQTKPLDNEHHGKMLYLIYNLKKQAQAVLPTQDNIQRNFIQDLEKIKSQELDVAAKRRIIDDMFKKYSFLGLIKKNSA
ncbi:MAG TPA: hypothetical protein VLB80_01195 [Candidatus Babeliales bacterium]|nr:hypothetical protein [Candidatus Babeliales bacterium]